MPSDLMTSTMKSEPARPPSGESTLGSSVSAAICCAVGRCTVGIFSAATGGAAASATGGVAIVAPATAAPARNLRRLTSGLLEFLRAIGCLPLQLRHRDPTPPFPAQPERE